MIMIMIAQINNSAATPTHDSCISSACVDWILFCSQLFTQLLLIDRLIRSSECGKLRVALKVLLSSLLGVWQAIN